MNNIEDIPYGYCHCGCGQKTTINPDSCRSRGYVKGEPRRFIWGHHIRFKGIRKETSRKSLKIKGERLTEYQNIVEDILGYKLPPKAMIHHVNGNCHDNATSNLVVCQNDEYHKLLHRRTRALKACGHANWLKCSFCKQYDSPDNIHTTKYGQNLHVECRREYGKKHWIKRKLLAEIGYKGDE